MADQSVDNEEFYDDGNVGEVFVDDESSSKIAELTERITLLEKEKGALNSENDENKKKIEELKASVKELTTKSGEFKDRAEEADRVLGSVAARASVLEGEASKLHHDLASTESDLNETNVELTELKKELEEVKEREKSKDVELGAVVLEKQLLLAKVEKLEGLESGLRVELEGKEKEIRSLKKNVEELNAIVESGKTLEKINNELEKTVESLKGKVIALEKEKFISEVELKERASVDSVNGSFNGHVPLDGEKKGLAGDWKQKNWVVIGGSTVAAVAVIGAACHVFAARKN